MTVAVWRVIVAEDGQHALDGNAGSAGGNGDDRLLQVLILVLGVRLAHYNVDLAPWVSGTAGPPFLSCHQYVIQRIARKYGTYLSVQDPLVALLMHPQLNVSSIRTGYLWFSHEEGTPDLSFQQRIQPLSLLLLGSVLCEDLHVTSVGCRAIACLGSDQALAEDLSHETVFKVAEAGAFLEVVLREEQVPQTELTSFSLEVLEDLRMSSETCLDVLPDHGAHDWIGRNAFFLNEFLEDVKVFLRPLADERKGHGWDPLGGGWWCLAIGGGRDAGGGDGLRHIHCFRTICERYQD